ALEPLLSAAWAQIVPPSARAARRTVKRRRFMEDGDRKTLRRRWGENVQRQSCLIRIKGAWWLPRKDSNLDKKLQRLPCYRYTTRQLLGRNHASIRRFAQKYFSGGKPRRPGASDARGADHTSCRITREP